MIEYAKIHSSGGQLCDGKDCLAHAGGYHTQACIIRDSEGIAVDHDDANCECDPIWYEPNTQT